MKMLTKSLILVLLSSSLILAKPFTEEDRSVEESFGQAFLQWYKDGKNIPVDYWASRKNEGENALKKLKKEGHFNVDLDPSTYNYLVDQANDVIDENAKSVQDVIDLWTKRVDAAVAYDKKHPDNAWPREQQVRLSAEFETLKALQKADKNWSQWEKEAVKAFEQQQGPRPEILY